MIKALADESQLVFTLLTVVGAALAIPDVWVKVGVAVAALVIGLLVHQTVSSPSTVANAVQNAALQTAAGLTAKTVGAAGEITDAASNVTTGVVSSVLNDVGGLVSKLTGSIASPAPTGVLPEQGGA
jgi:hypothetical protein